MALAVRAGRVGALPVRASGDPGIPPTSVLSQPALDGQPTPTDPSPSRTNSSPSCQRQDWNRGHKYECSRLQNQQAIAAANKVAAAKGKAARRQQQSQLNGSKGPRPKAAQHEPEEEAPVPQQVGAPGMRDNRALR